MAYKRKTSDRARAGAAWLRRRRAALIASGIPRRELDVLRWYDVEQMTFRQIGTRLKLSSSRTSQIYYHCRRMLKHPRRKHLVSAGLR